MQGSSTLLGQNRVDMSSRGFRSLHGNGGGSWIVPTSDSWSSPSGDPWNYWASDPEISNISSPEMASPSSFCSLVEMSPYSSAMTEASSSVAFRSGQVEQEARSSPSTPSSSLSSSSSSTSSSSSSSSSCEESGRSSSSGGVGRRRLRLKNPSRQRQCASEKEKLRMRDLTKALHHLRTYLPPSVAPEGQTLTKIQTLRLAIRYIDHLSAQLGSRDGLCKPNRGGDEFVSASWGNGLQLEGERFSAGQCWGSAAPHYSGKTEPKQRLWQRNIDLSMCTEQQNSSMDSTYDDLFGYNVNTLFQEDRQSYQEYGKDMAFHSMTPKHWLQTP